MSRKEDVVISDEEKAIIRESYIANIRSIAPLDALEAHDIEETLAWLKSAQELHKPFNMNKHLGVLFLLLSPDRKSTFLINHKKAQMWIPPGGHVDSGLTFQEAVKLEMREELQVDTVFIEQSPFFLTQTLTSGLNAGHTDITAWFLVEGDQFANYQVQEKEATEGRWFAISQLVDDSAMSHLARVGAKIQEASLG